MRSKGDFRWLFERLRPLGWRIALGIVSVTLASFAASVDPLLMRALIDGALPQRQFRWAFELVSSIGVCYIARSVLNAIGSLINFSIAQNFLRDLRIALVGQMNRLSTDYHEQTAVGEKMTRIEYDVEEIARLGADTGYQCMRAALFFALSLVMMVRLNLPMTLALLPLLPLFAMIQKQFGGLLKIRSNQVRVEVGAAASLLNEYLASVTQIQFLVAEEASTRRLVSVWDRVLGKQWIQRRAQIGFSLSVGAILVTAILIVLAYGSNKLLSGTLTMGGLVAFYTYGTRIFDPISSAMDIYTRLQSVGANIRRVREVLELEPTVRDQGTIYFESPRIKCGFEVENVSFSYGRGPVLNNISFRIGAQERIAIIGRSGSGKSTLARLLVRSIDPAQGRILLAGHSLADYTLASLRKTVAYVPQHPVLFQGSVRENLWYGNPRATTEEMHRALEVAQFGSILHRLPQGLETDLSPGAISMSGGERQRLAIARSLLGESAVLILDEATSALDAPTEREALRSLGNVCARRLLIVISHRISSLTWMDRLFLLDEGQLVASGPHSGLYSGSALYRELFNASTEDGGQI